MSEFAYRLIHTDTDYDNPDIEVATAASHQDLMDFADQWGRSEWSGPYRLADGNVLWIMDGPAGQAFKVIGPWDGPANDFLLREISPPDTERSV